jgi:hypothetical protein
VALGRSGSAGEGGLGEKAAPLGKGKRPSEWQNTIGSRASTFGRAAAGRLEVEGAETCVHRDLRARGPGVLAVGSGCEGFLQKDLEGRGWRAV